jgi:hypothetical protein
MYVMICLEEHLVLVSNQLYPNFVLIYGDANPTQTV